MQVKASQTSECFRAGESGQMLGDSCARFTI